MTDAAAAAGATPVNTHTRTQVHTWRGRTQLSTFHSCACYNASLHIHKIPMSVTHTHCVIHLKQVANGELHGKTNFWRYTEVY